MHYYTSEEIKALPLQVFRKVALVQARPLTQEDYLQRGGLLQTREGSVHFEPGDYLARGIYGEEWPILQAEFVAHYEQIAPPDAQGFASYRATRLRQAIQIFEAFSVTMKNGDTVMGRPGDYLVWSSDNAWIVERSIFEKSYKRVQQEP